MCVCVCVCVNIPLRSQPPHEPLTAIKLLNLLSLSLSLSLSLYICIYIYTHTHTHIHIICNSPYTCTSLLSYTQALIKHISLYSCLIKCFSFNGFGSPPALSRGPAPPPPTPPIPSLASGVRKNWREPAPAGNPAPAPAPAPLPPPEIRTSGACG